jgi:hypothetical protein
MYHHIIDGVVKDWHFRDMPNHDGYFFYLDDTFIGYIYKLRTHSWTAIAIGGSPNGQRSVKGFGSRADAAEYLIQVLSDDVISELTRSKKNESS